MKKTLLFIALLSLHIAAAQDQVAERAQLIQSEKLAAQNKLAFRANPLTANYDLTYQKLEFDVDPAMRFIKGKVTTQFTALEPLSTVVFELSSELQVKRVLQNDMALVFDSESDLLKIDLIQAVSAGNQATVLIEYEGVPPRAQEAFVTSSHAGVPILWTLSQPFGASDWWPCKQDLTDKIDRLDVFITAPAMYTAVANGKEVSQLIRDNGTKTTHFSHNYAIPAYLVAMAVTNYQVYNQSAGTAPDNFPIVNYLYPERYNAVVPQLQQTVPIMNLFEKRFGTYPYAAEKYGHAQFGWGGGMEHSTVSFMGAFTQGLIAHELAHQWFGDKVTCGSWRDIWLNEGFAEYAAGLVVEEIQGVEEFKNWRRYLTASITSQAGGNLYLTPSQAEDPDRIFSSRITYNKGAMVVHMLRYVLGDDNFFKGVKAYLSDANLSYKHALTPDLKAHLEAASGVDLTVFFQQWVYGQGYPTLKLNWSQSENGVLVGQLDQSTSHASIPFFQFPVELQFLGNQGESQTRRLDLVQNNQYIEIPLDFTVNSVVVDPMKHLISGPAEVTLSVPDFSQSTLDIQLVPNPATSHLEVLVPETVNLIQLALVDGKGAKLQISKEAKLSISHLAAGKHWIEITTNRGVFHKSFIKK